jgi:hypothetical protein
MQCRAVLGVQVSDQRPAQRPSRSDRDCPLDTAGDRCLWHVGGTAGEYDSCPHVTATAPSCWEGEARLSDYRLGGKSPEGSRQPDTGTTGRRPAPLRASSVVEFMRDPLDLCFQPAFTLSPYVATDDRCDMRHRFVSGNCRLVMYQRVDDRCHQLGALVLSGTSQDEGHVEETTRLVQIPTPIGVGFCCIASALVGNVDGSGGGSAGECEPCTHQSVL